MKFKKLPAAVASATLLAGALAGCESSPPDTPPETTAPTVLDAVLPPPVIEAARAVVAVSSHKGRGSGVKIQPDLFMTTGKEATDGCAGMTIDAQTPSGPVRVPALHAAGRYEGSDLLTRNDRGLVYAPSQAFAELPSAVFGGAPPDGNTVYAVTWQSAGPQNSDRNPATGGTEELRQPSVLSLKVLGRTTAGTLILASDGFAYDLRTGKATAGDTAIKPEGGGGGGGVFDRWGRLTAEISAGGLASAAQKSQIEGLLRHPISQDAIDNGLAIAQLVDPDILDMRETSVVC